MGLGSPDESNGQLPWPMFSFPTGLLANDHLRCDSLIDNGIGNPKEDLSWEMLTSLPPQFCVTPLRFPSLFISCSVETHRRLPELLLSTHDESNSNKFRSMNQSEPQCPHPLTHPPPSSLLSVLRPMPNGLVNLVSLLSTTC